MQGMTTYYLILPNQIQAAGSLIGLVSEYFCKLFNLYQFYAVYEGISLVLVQQCNAPGVQMLYCIFFLARTVLLLLLVFGCVVATVIIAEGIVRLQDSNNVLGRSYSDYIHYVNYYQEIIVFSLSLFFFLEVIFQPISLHPIKHWIITRTKNVAKPFECFPINKVPKLHIPCSSLANSQKNFPASLEEKFSAEKKLNFYFLKAFGLMKISYPFLCACEKLVFF